MEKTVTIKSNVNQEINKIYNEFKSNIPNYLYHYTAIDGFMGIIDNNSLWASNMRFMNDSQEYNYGVDIFEKYIEELLVKQSNLLSKIEINFLNDLKQTLDTSFAYELFCTCFSSEPDQLSQWRGYCAGTTGVCIEFSSIGLQLLAKKPHDDDSKNSYMYSNNSSPQRVIYKREEQNEIVKRFINIGLKASMDYYKETGKDESGRIISGFIFERILNILVLFKDYSFHEEREWRSIFTRISNEKNNKVHFRIRNGIIIPYMIVTQCTTNEKVVEEKLDINKIIVGPSNQSEFAIESIKYFMKHKNMYNEVITSEIPYR